MKTEFNYKMNNSISNNSINKIDDLDQISYNNFSQRPYAYDPNSKNVMSNLAKAVN